MPKRNRPTIFIVDRNKPEMDVFAEILRNDYALLMAMNGSHLFEIAAKEQPDLILLAADLPEVDCRELGRRLKLSEPTRNIPLLLITGETRPEEEYGYFESGILILYTGP